MEVALITSVCRYSFVILGHISVDTILSLLSKKEVSDTSLFFLLTRLKIGGVQVRGQKSLANQSSST